LTAHYGTAHGDAIALMLPHIVRWNAPIAANQYAELLSLAKISFTSNPAEALAARLESLIDAGRLPRGLKQAGVRRDELAKLAADAATQWTGKFNPRPFGAEEALEVYECAF
jgi:alcohol dehydrogenase